MDLLITTNANTPWHMAKDKYAANMKSIFDLTIPLFVIKLKIFQQFLVTLHPFNMRYNLHLTGNLLSDFSSIQLRAVEPHIIYVFTQLKYIPLL